MSAPAPAEREGVRLQKVLSEAGVASRRAAEELIDQGRVTVDGEVVRVQGRRVDPATARIEVDGERIATNPALEYVMLNKPTGYVTTANDPRGRPTVMDLVRSKRRLYPVGRLDLDTTGLVLMTNHGELAHRMMHPRYEVPRRYVAEVRGEMGEAALRRLTSGVELEDGFARAVEASVRQTARTRSHVEVTMLEGRKHEVRRLLDAVGHPVVSLTRVAFGPLRLGQLPMGSTRPLTPAEVGRVLRLVGL